MFNPLIKQTTARKLKPLVFVACLLPALPALHSLLALVVSNLTGSATNAIVTSVRFWHFASKPDPIAKLLHEQGELALQFLVATIAITPIRHITGQNWLILFRRMLGLFGFTYALLHFLIWIAMDQSFDWPSIVADILKRPFIMIGLLGLILMIPLAATSTNYMMRLMGKRWLQLHRLVYLIVPLGVWHFYWLVKKDISEPLMYGAITAFLLGYRYWRSKHDGQNTLSNSATESH